MDLVDARSAWYPVLGFSAALFLLIFANYGASLESQVLDRTYALVAVVLISAAFLIGSLSRFWPNGVFESLKPYRRPLGISGVFFALNHVFLVVVPLSMVSSSLRFAIAALAFLIFFSMILTSTRFVLSRIDYGLWKRVHQFGYLGLALVVVHFGAALFRNGHSLTLSEWFVLVLASLTLLMRALVFFAGPSPGAKNEELNWPGQEVFRINTLRKILKSSDEKKRRLKKMKPSGFRPE